MFPSAKVKHIKYILPTVWAMTSLLYHKRMNVVSLWITTTDSVLECPILGRLSRAPHDRPRPRDRATPAPHSSPRGRRRNNPLFDHETSPTSVICTHCTLSRPICHKAHWKSPFRNRRGVGRAIACDDNKIGIFLVRSDSSVRNSLQIRGRHDKVLFHCLEPNLRAKTKLKTEQN